MRDLENCGWGFNQPRGRGMFVKVPAFIADDDCTRELAAMDRAPTSSATSAGGQQCAGYVYWVLNNGMSTRSFNH